MKETQAKERIRVLSGDVDIDTQKHERVQKQVLQVEKEISKLRKEKQGTIRVRVSSRLRMETQELGACHGVGLEA